MPVNLPALAVPVLFEQLLDVPICVTLDHVALAIHAVAFFVALLADAGRLPFSARTKTGISSFSFMQSLLRA